MKKKKRKQCTFYVYILWWLKNIYKLFTINMNLTVNEFKKFQASKFL